MFNQNLEPSLLGAPRRDGFTFSDGGRPLMMRPGVDIRNQNFNQPPLLSRIPMQPPSSSMHPQGGWLVDEESRAPLPGRPAGSYSNQFPHGIQGSAPVTNPSHLRSEEVGLVFYVFILRHQNYAIYGLRVFFAVMCG